MRASAATRGSLDRWLIAVLLPLWLVCLGFHVKEIVRTGFAEPPVFASPASAPDGFPSVGGFRRERGRGGDALAVGDRLIRVGDADLRGVGYVGFDAIALEQAGLKGAVPIVFERDGSRREIRLELLRSRFPWYRVLPVLAWVVVVLLILLRAPGRHSRRIFVAVMAVAILTTPFFGGPRAQSYAALAVFHLVGGVAFILILRWTIQFPYEVPERDRLSPAWSWLGALWWVVRIGYFVPGPIPAERVADLAIALDGFLVLGTLAFASWNYAHSDPIGKRRVKWLLLSGYLGIAPLGLVTLLASFDPALAHLELLFEIGVMLFVLVPVGLLVGVLRYNLYDVDRLLSATASYSALGIALLATALTLMPRVAQAGSDLLGIGAGQGQTALSFLLALAIVPAHQRVRPHLDRLLFRERFALGQGVETLLRELSSCSGPDALARLAGERLDTLLRPECTILYVRRADRDLFEPAFVRGRAVPPAFPTVSPLISALEARTGPLTSESLAGGRGRIELDPFNRAALETLGVPLVLPVRRGDALVGFVCLGPKRSGDVYTSTDIALLTAISEKISSELMRFDQTQMLAAGQALQASLRRYVPGAIAEQLESGADLEAGEREVTVLFVDLRSYTAYSEGRRAEEIFSTVNRYTDAVSRAVRTAGGTVVEFNGDGMMTVFGAPRALAGKERHALRAAHEIVSAVAALFAADGEAPLTVGIGIATGPAFVGNIRAVDRLIWSAIGNTTNLAARLQQKTRELDAAILADAATWRAAGESAAGWVVHARTPVRGRPEPLDLYGWPIDAPPGAQS